MEEGQGGSEVLLHNDIRAVHGLPRLVAFEVEYVRLCFRVVVRGNVHGSFSFSLYILNLSRKWVGAARPAFARYASGSGGRETSAHACVV